MSDVSKQQDTACGGIGDFRPGNRPVVWQQGGDDREDREAITSQPQRTAPREVSRAEKRLASQFAKAKPSNRSRKQIYGQTVGV